MNRGTKLIIVFGVLALLGLIGITIGLTIKDSVYSARITLEIAPAESKVAVDGKIRKPGVIRVRPGSVRVVVSMDGFETFTQQVSVGKGENYYVGVALLSNSSETANWYQDHANDQSIAERISSKNFDIVSEKAVQNVPFVNELPYIGAGFEFRIDYGPPEPGASGDKPAIYITALTQQARDDALLWMKNRGYDPANFTIIYINKDPSQ